MISAKSNRHPNTFNRVALVFLVIGTVVAAAVFSSTAVSSQGGDPQRRDLDRVFSRHERLTLDPGQIQEQVKQTRALTLNTSRGSFEMTLEPHDMRAPGYVAEGWGDNGVTVLERAPVRTYKGTVKGQPGAQARLTIDEGTVEGLIVTPSELFFLEPIKRYSGTAAKTDFVFYAGSDVKESAGECGNTMAEMVEQHSANVSNQTSAKGPQPEEVFGPALEIGIALEADLEYFQLLANEAATVAQIESIMNQVEGIYNAQIGLQFLILHTRVWTGNDPYTESAPSALLNEFRTSYTANPPPQAAGRDLAHLFTGRNLDGSTIGIAFLPGLDCNSTAFAYGLSQNITGNRAGLTAHEIGHNLSAAHVTSAQGGDCTQSIMNPSISGTTDFCQFSRDEITDHALAMRACLTPLTQPGCTYAISPNSQSIPAGGGGGSVGVTTTAGCNWAVAEGQSWLSVTSGATGSGSGTVNFSATSNSVCGPRSALMSIGGQPFTVNQAGNPNYLIDQSTATAIAPFQTLNGALSPADCTYGVFASGRQDAYMDRYKFNGTAGQNIRIEMNAAIPPQAGGLDTYLYLLDANGNIVAQNDDIHLGTVTNSRIHCVDGQTAPCPLDFFTLPQTGTYIIVATSFSDNETGAYSLTLTLFSPLAQEANTSAVAALNSVTFAATSNADHTAFRIVDPHNFSSDQITRLILFTPDLGLPIQQGPDPSVLQVRAGGQELVVENVGPFAFPGLSGSYVVVALKRRDLQPMLTGNLAFTVTVRGKTSTPLAITIAP